MGSKYKYLLILVIAIVIPEVLFAHSGVGDTSGFSHGFFHPLVGVEHLLVMVAVGLWSAQLGGKATWIVPLIFVSLMVLGSLIPLLGVDFIFAKNGVLVSVVVLGVLIAASIKMPVLLGSFVVGLFALFHGHSHGAEMLLESSGVAYVLGLLLTTILLHIIGILIGYSFKKWDSESVVRLAGAFVAIFGISLFVI